MTYRIPRYAFLMSAILLGTALPALFTETEAKKKQHSH